MSVNDNTEKCGKSKAASIFKRNISGWILLIPTVLLFAYILWRPIIIGIIYSFFKLKGFTPVEFVGFANYRDILSDTNFLQTLANTVKYVGWSIVIGFPLPIICAVLINELIHWKSYFKVSTYLPVIVPAIAASMIWKMVFSDSEGGLLNSFLYQINIGPLQWLSNKHLAIPLIIVSMSWRGFGSTLIIFLASLQSIDQELYEAARLDGAGFWGRVRHVLLPHLRGVMLLSIILQIISVFSVTEQPLTMTGGGPGNASMSLGLTNYFYAFKYGQYEKSLALGVITFLILIGFTIVYFVLDKKLKD